ncbi:MAG: hypothetical protein KDK45_18150, partial [Leptospiraceae bacterium]|nr:hypothetical protein [Leptospiraceae bacterium]
MNTTRKYEVVSFYFGEKNSEFADTSGHSPDISVINFTDYTIPDSKVRRKEKKLLDFINEETAVGIQKLTQFLDSHKIIAGLLILTFLGIFSLILFKTIIPSETSLFSQKKQTHELNSNSLQITNAIPSFLLEAPDLSSREIVSIPPFHTMELIDTKKAYIV